MEDVVRKNQKTLRRGITTGTCATAAAMAATSNLLLGISKETIRIITPNNTKVDVAVNEMQCDERCCEYMVIKDSGDDPDVTNHMQLHVCVKKIDGNINELSFTYEKNNHLHLDGGVGIGRVTKDGLEQGIGQAAINAVPRKMIFEAVDEIYALSDYQGDLMIEVFAPDGEELAKKTFNERLGIEGGISILGTSGILEPMSEKAIVDTIEVEIRQLATLGNQSLLVTPGNYGQAYASDYLHLDLSHSVKCSNYIGDTIDLAISYGMQDFLLVGNIGKLVKLAAGIMNTHSRVADGRCEIVATHTALCGGDSDMVKRIMDCINTDEMLKCLNEWGICDAVIHSICDKIDDCMDLRIRGQMKYGVMLFSEKYGFLGQTKYAEELLEKFKALSSKDVICD